MFNYNPNTLPNYNFNYQQTPQMTQPTVINPDERIWVQNATAAESYLVAPNGFVRLWDSNRPRFYERKADASGRLYPMETYEYNRVMPQEPSSSANLTTDYQREIEALKGRIEALERGVRNESNTDNATVPTVSAEL